MTNEADQPSPPAPPAGGAPASTEGRAPAHRRRNAVLRSAALVVAAGLTVTAGVLVATRPAAPAAKAPSPTRTGSGKTQRVTTVSVGGPTGPTNEQIAARYATYLMALARLPAGSSRLSTTRPAGSPPELDNPATVSLSSSQVTRTRYAIVPEPPEALIAWFVAHPPAGSRADQSGQTSGPHQPTLHDEGFVWPSTQALDQPYMLVGVVAYGHGESIVRVDTQVVYHPNRSAAETVPAGVDRLVITISHSGGQKSWMITRPAEIAAFVRVLDSLARPVYTVNPGGPCLCGVAASQSFTASLYVPASKSPVVTVSDTPDVAEMGTGNVLVQRGPRHEPILEERDYDLTRVVAADTGFRFAVLGS